MMTPADLRRLADQATPGGGDPLGIRVSDVALYTLGPDLARLCADMADALFYVEGGRERVGIQSPGALLARLEALT